MQLLQVQKGDVAKALGVAMGGRLLESLQVRLGLHYFRVMLAIRALVQNGQPDGALKGPAQLAIEDALHGVDKQGDEVGAALGIGGLQVQAQAELVPWTARVEAWAMLDHWQACFLVAQVGRKAFEVPDVDALALLGLQLLHSLLQ